LPVITQQPFRSKLKQGQSWEGEESNAWVATRPKAELINIDDNEGICLDLNALRIHQCPSFEHFIHMTGERSSTWDLAGPADENAGCCLKALLMVGVLLHEQVI